MKAAIGTPMMAQYLEIKRAHPEEILLFRLGDFYEMFFDDAELASKELEITLTSRGGGLEKRVPMCGVPYHAAENYIARLIQKGYKVAICEQVEDPKQVKGIVRREVIKIITPGTVLAENLLADGSNNYLVVLNQAAEEIFLAAADISTGECLWGQYAGRAGREALFDQLYRLAPAEIALAGVVRVKAELDVFVKQRLPSCIFTALKAEYGDDAALLSRHFAEPPPADGARRALTMLLQYLRDTVKNDLSHINRLTYLDQNDHLLMDIYTLRNLEITRNLRDGGKKDTLLAVLDHTCTAMGGRLLKKWLELPLKNVHRIKLRQAAVAELHGDFTGRRAVQDALKGVYDFERLLTRIEVGSANARDLTALKASLQRLPLLRQALAGYQAPLLRQNGGALALHEEITRLLDAAVVEAPPFSVRDGGMIKEGYRAELDELRAMAKDSRRMLQLMEAKEREATGIRSLKVGYNKVFGYYIEVTHTNAAAVPAHYARKQTLANAERYITPDLKEFETKILGAQERIVNLEYQLFTELREEIKRVLPAIQETARQVALIDALAALGEAASRYNYVCPEITRDGAITIKDGRHPVVERLLTDELFVPNDTALSHQDGEVMIITGPNMAGKSTYMRQVALLTLMAQTGGFVPARQAAISPVDQIFTRIGASDDLSSGESTFMVEMKEVAQILQHATKRSLILLDEIGRGTSTFDGMSIARAVLEYIKDRIGALTLFATHYHELTDLADARPSMRNYSVAVKERGGDVVFLRRIIAGGADKSYGIYVAKLAGLPRAVTERAKNILAELEAGRHGPAAPPSAAPAAPADEFSLFRSSLSDALLALDVATMTPLEALNVLFQLQEQARREVGKG